ncbi:hypothetical protein BC941DRAFT_449113 [Chlamydoabsidia padenii]|nr:hypothetical protein BC941DRAFT_449113 [Chlamydoabsidia padenii]
MSVKVTLTDTVVKEETLIVLNNSGDDDGGDGQEYIDYLIVHNKYPPHSDDGGGDGAPGGEVVEVEVDDVTKVDSAATVHNKMVVTLTDYTILTVSDYKTEDENTTLTVVSMIAGDDRRIDHGCLHHHNQMLVKVVEMKKMKKTMEKTASFVVESGQVDFLV